MRLCLLGAVLIAAALSSIAASHAADGPRWQSNPATAHPLPFPRDERAQAIWDERACWSSCGSACTWGLHACLRTDAQGQCLTSADACDRACQRSCRTSGGPFLPLDF